MGTPSPASACPRTPVRGAPFHRVVIIDPRTDRIVWQYGHTGQTGTAPGFLNKPDGVDLVPPYSFDIIRAKTMGQPTTTTP